MLPGCCVFTCVLGGEGLSSKSFSRHDPSCGALEAVLIDDDDGRSFVRSLHFVTVVRVILRRWSVGAASPRHGLFARPNGGTGLDVLHSREVTFLSYTGLCDVLLDYFGLFPLLSFSRAFRPQCIYIYIYSLAV